MSTDGFVGAALVTRDGEVLVERTGGAARDGVPWTPRTPTQIASISKQFAAVVALGLVDRGALTLTHTVADLLPDTDRPWSGVTVEHLLTHTGGVRHWDDTLPGFRPDVPLMPEERVRLLLDGPLLSPPGEIWRYSSPGYILLAATLAAAATTPYPDLVRALAIEPLSLTETTTGEPPGPDAAAGHRAGEPIPTWDLHTMAGTGDIWSSAHDLARFVTELHSGELVAAGVRPLMARSVPRAVEPVVAGAITTARYGLGHFVGTIDGRPAILHPGDNPGYQSLAAWQPDTRTVGVVLTNDEDQDVETALVEILRSAPSISP